MCVCGSLLYRLYEADDCGPSPPSRGLLDFPYKQSHVRLLYPLSGFNRPRIIMIVAGSFVGVQFLKVIFQGIRASELKGGKSDNESLIDDVGMMSGKREVMCRWKLPELAIARRRLRSTILASITPRRIKLLALVVLVPITVIR